MVTSSFALGALVAFLFFFQAEDGIRDVAVTGVQTCALPICYFNIFGPRQDPSSPYSGVLAKFCTAFLEDTPPVVFGDGEQTRDFTFVDNEIGRASCRERV